MTGMTCRWGFVRLIKTGPNCEIVLAIGNRDNWGRSLGARTILAKA